MFRVFSILFVLTVRPSNSMPHTYVHATRLAGFAKNTNDVRLFTACFLSRGSSGTPPSLLLSEADRLLDGPGELLREHFVGLVGRQIQAVEARMRLGELRFFARLLDREATGSVGTLEILETVDGDTRSTGGELQEAGFLLGVPATDDL